MKKTININRNNRRVNVNSYLRDSEIDDTTINVSGKNSRQYNVAKRKANSLESKIRQVLHYICIIALLVLTISIGIRANAEEVTLETIIEKEEITDQDIDKFIELIEETEVEEDIKPENIENSDKAYKEFMEEIKRVELQKVVGLTKKEEIKPLRFDKNIQIRKDNLNICKEVKITHDINSDVYRCASYMSMIQFLETNNGKTGIGPDYKNMFGLKLPTDKIGLVGDWKLGDDGVHIKFETYEMSKYAFAYYYMGYHSKRSVDNFVKRYVGWNNTNYKQFLYNNYQLVLKEYKSID